MMKTFGNIQNNKTVHIESHFSGILFSIQTLSSDRPQFLHDAIDELLNKRKSFIYSQCTDGYPGSCWKTYANW